MSIEGGGKFSDGLLIYWGVLAHNILKNKALCFMPRSVKFSDSPQYPPSFPVYHAKAGARALAVHRLYAIAPAHHNPRCERQHPSSRARVSDRGEGSDIRVRWGQLRRCQLSVHFCCRR